jgi:DNA repair protein RadA
MDKDHFKLFDLLELNGDNLIKTKNLKEKLRKNKANQEIIKTKCNNLNDLLGGGFYNKRGYLIFGAGKTGKTQLMHQLCVNYVSPQFGIANRKTKKIFYLDTEGTFRPERISQLASFCNLNAKTLLQKIFVSKILSNSALLISLEDLEQKLEKFDLLIIDSLNNHFRSESSSKENHFQTTKNTFLQILDKLYEFVIKYDLFLICTAQVSNFFMEDKIIQEYPIGNQYLNNYFSEYLYFKHKDNNYYFAHLVNSSFLPEKKVMFQLTEKGVQDFEL